MSPAQSSTTIAARAPVFPPTQVHATPDGMRLVLRPSRANDIVALKVYLPMGPLYEGEEEAGLSNLMQEMLLHGTRRRSEDELQDALADLGAKLTTSAGGDAGSVTLRVARKELPGALDLLDEILTEPALEAGEVEKEKVRILNRIKAQADSLLTAAFELFRETFYGDHPYHKPVLGYPAAVSTFETSHLQAARLRFYQQRHLVVSAVGNFEPEELRARLGQLGLELGDGALAVRPSGGISLARSREVVKRRESQAAWMVLGFPAPSYRDPDYAAARLLDAILGGSMDSRLFTELRERRSLAYQVATHYNDQLSQSFLAGYIGTSPGKFVEAREAMLREFHRIAVEPVAPQELDRAKSYLRGSYIISAETNGAQAARQGRYEFYGLGQDFGDRLLERIAAVTAEEIRSVGERYFGRHVLAVIHPDAASLERLALEGTPPELHETIRTDLSEEESG